MGRQPSYDPSLYTKVSAEGSALRYWEPLELSPRHKTIIALAATGLTNIEIAETMGCSEVHVSIVRNHPDTEPILAKLSADHIINITEDVGQCISAAAKEAFLVNMDLMRNSASDIVKQRSAFDILDRAGFKPKEVQVRQKVVLEKGAGEEIRVGLREAYGQIQELPQMENAAEQLMKAKQEEENGDFYEIVETTFPQSNGK